MIFSLIFMTFTSLDETSSTQSLTLFSVYVQCLDVIIHFHGFIYNTYVDHPYILFLALTSSLTPDSPLATPLVYLLGMLTFLCSKWSFCFPDLYKPASPFAPLSKRHSVVQAKIQESSGSFSFPTPRSCPPTGPVNSVFKIHRINHLLKLTALPKSKLSFTYTIPMTSKLVFLYSVEYHIS